MSTRQTTDFARPDQVKISPLPEKGKFSVQQWAVLLDRELDTVTQHFEEKEVPCIPLGTLVIVDAEDLWAAIPKQPFQRRRPQKESEHGPKKSKRRRNDLQNE